MKMFSQNTFFSIVKQKIIQKFIVSADILYKQKVKGDCLIIRFCFHFNLTLRTRSH